MRDLLPLAHRPEILGPELRAAGAQTLTCFGLHMPTRLFAADPDGARERALAATLRSLDSVLAEPIARLPVARRRRAPVRRGAHARSTSRPSSACPAATSSTATWPGRSPRREAEVGDLGRRDRRPARALCGAGARRGGGVSGVPGRNAAMAVLHG